MDLRLLGQDTLNFLEQKTDAIFAFACLVYFSGGMAYCLGLFDVPERPSS